MSMEIIWLKFKNFINSLSFSLKISISVLGLWFSLMAFRDDFHYDVGCIDIFIFLTFY